MKLPLLLILIYFSSHLNFNLDKGIKHQQWAMCEGRQKAQARGPRDVVGEEAVFAHSLRQGSAVGR